MYCCTFSNNLKKLKGSWAIWEVGGGGDLHPLRWNPAKCLDVHTYLAHTHFLLPMGATHVGMDIFDENGSRKIWGNMQRIKTPGHHRVKLLCIYRWCIIERATLVFETSIEMGVEGGVGVGRMSWSIRKMVNVGGGGQCTELTVMDASLFAFN